VVISSCLFVAIFYLKKYTKGYFEKKARNRELLSSKIELDTALTLLRQSYEKDKEAFSKTLHDEVGNSQASMRLMVDALGRTRYEGDFGMLLAMQKELNRSLSIVRNISKDAYPPSLKQYGLGFAIAELCERLSNPKLTKISFVESENGQRLHKDTELVLYRATQELIGNAVKHSLAWSVNVRLDWYEKELVIKVEDNGIGYGPWKKDKGGIGLKSIISSLKSINGKVFLDRERLGFMAEITYPISNEIHQSLYSRRS